MCGIYWSSVFIPHSFLAVQPILVEDNRRDASEVYCLSKGRQNERGGQGRDGSTGHRLRPVLGAARNVEMAVRNLCCAVQTVLIDATGDGHEGGRQLVAAVRLRRRGRVALNKILRRVRRLVEFIVLAADRGDLERIAELITGLEEQLGGAELASRAVIHNSGVVHAECADHVAGQGRDGKDPRVDRLERFLLGQAEQVRHDHATLGVGVPDTDANAAAGLDNLVGHVGIRADAVAHERELADDADVFGAQAREHREEADDSRGAALVAVHASHVAAVLDVGAAGVVGDALADEEDGGGDLALALVLEVRDAGAMALDDSGAAGHGGQKGILAAEQDGVLLDLDRHWGLHEEILDVRCHAGRGHALGIGPADITSSRPTGLDGRQNLQIALSDVVRRHHKDSLGAELLSATLTRLERHIVRGQYAQDGDLLVAREVLKHIAGGGDEHSRSLCARPQGPLKTLLRSIGVPADIINVAVQRACGREHEAALGSARADHEGHLIGDRAVHRLRIRKNLLEAGDLRHIERGGADHHEGVGTIEGVPCQRQWNSSHHCLL
eukprot:m.227297 g.227297  ORF g.227297 m.227297 type:complete len:555 (-) comp11567_c0_seq1:330-1994(-)